MLSAARAPGVKGREYSAISCMFLTDGWQVVQVYYNPYRLIYYILIVSLFRIFMTKYTRTSYYCTRYIEFTLDFTCFYQSKNSLLHILQFLLPLLPSRSIRNAKTVQRIQCEYARSKAVQPRRKQI